MFQKSQEILLARKRAYARIFDIEQPDCKVILNDLERFCRANDSTFSPDPRVHALLEGRREVYLRIKDFIELELDDLIIKYKGVKDE